MRECSNCGQIYNKKTNHCPLCGKPKEMSRTVRVGKEK
jgi:RNA polymerase subunit RPABC4/transcription elongation factor Spt4